MRLVTNTDLAQQIIARYTSFLSAAASGAELTFLEAPVGEQPQRGLLEQRQEIRHIHHCIEQNTMVSVNLNLQFLHQMMTRALRQVSGDYQRAVQMLERPMLLERPAETRLVRIDTLATRTLLREWQQREPQLMSVVPKAGQRPPDPARALLRRSLMQLSARAPQPVVIEYPAPAGQGESSAAARPQVRSSELLLAAAPPVPLRNFPRAADAPLTENGMPPARPQPARRLPPLSESPTANRTKPGVMQTAPSLLVQPSEMLEGLANRQKSEALRPEYPTPTSQIPPASTPLLHPAAQPATQPGTAPAVQQASVSPPLAVQRTSVSPPLAAQRAAVSPPLAVQRAAASPSLAAQQQEFLHPEHPSATPLRHPQIQASQPAQLNFAPVTQIPARLIPPTSAPLLHPVNPTANQAAAQLPAQPNFDPASQPPARLISPALTPLLHPVNPTANQAAAQLPAQPNFVPAAQPPMTLKDPALRQTNALRSADPPIPASRIHPEMQPSTAERVPAARQTTDVPPPGNRIPTRPRTMLKPPMARPTRQLPEHLLLKRTAMHSPATALLALSPVSAAFLTQHTERTLPDGLSTQNPSQASIPRTNGFGLLSRTDAPATRVLRAEPSQPRPKNAEEQDDLMDIPTIRVKKAETQETKKESVQQNIAINAPQQTSTQAIRSTPSAAISESEILRITDKVYRALEGRLHSEKMRRGMW